jgi:hypothetical protein
MAQVTVTMADQGTAIMADQGSAIMADQGTAIMADQGTAIMADQGTAIMAATLPHITADIDRVTMLPPIMVPGTMALGTTGAGDRQARRLSRTRKVAEMSATFFVPTGSGYDETRARFKTSPLLARNGHGVMSDLSPLSGVKRKLDFWAVRSVDDPSATLGGLF